MPEKLSSFPYFLQFGPEFCNKEFMISTSVSSQSCLCWLYRASPSLAAKNIINLIWYWPSLMSMCRIFSCVVGRECLLWSVYSLGKALLAFACFILYSKAKFAHYSRYFLTSYFSIPGPYNEKDIFFGGMVLIIASCTMVRTSIHSSSGTVYQI